jgi:Tfp pilus assembly protein PilX
MRQQRTAGDERGIALVATIALMTVMLALGLAILAVVDTQSKASGTQREADSAFNLAEVAASSAAFVLSANWPEAPATAQP